MSHFDDLQKKIETKTAHVGIVGLGYVGLPLAVEFAAAGFNVTGIDIDAKKIAALNRGESYIQDIPTSVLAPLVKSGKLKATTDFAAAAAMDTINICVPTPLRKTKDPDMSYIVNACQEIAKHFHPGVLVILESTTYPGTTNELMLPMFERPGLKVGEDFFLCFSPERVDPGNVNFQTRNIPKVVGGITPACTKIGAVFYKQALETVIPVGSTRVAEMVKLLENTFRMINIGLVNEMAMLCDRMGIDVWEVIDAAATKPFGFMPFYPGPGLGRPLHSHRSVLPFVEDQTGGHRGALYRTGRLHQRQHAALRGGQNSERVERFSQAAQGFARAFAGRGLQTRHRRRSRVAGAGYHSPVGQARRQRDV